MIKLILFEVMKLYLLMEEVKKECQNKSAGNLQVTGAHLQPIRNQAAQKRLKASKFLG
jgi:hypothetical protein